MLVKKMQAFRRIIKKLVSRRMMSIALLLRPTKCSCKIQEKLDAAPQNPWQFFNVLLKKLLLSSPKTVNSFQKFEFLNIFSLEKQAFKKHSH